MAFIICLLIGYVASWLIMIGILETEYRLYGFGNLSVVALLVAFMLVLFLDSPLKLGLFKWDDAFWPDGVNLPERSSRQSRGVRLGNSFKVALFIVIVVGSIAGFASLIPQIESPAPEALEISGDLAGPELAALGEEIVNSADAGCLACHALGHEGLRAPDLAGIGGVAASREPGKSAEDYLYEALEDPCVYVVEGYDCIMPPTLAQALGPARVTAVVAFLQNQGGEITVSLSADEAADSAEDSSGVAGATGEEIVTNAAPSCSTCHQLDAIDAAGAIGPDLSQVGARLTPDEIRHSILMPDEVIAEDCPGAPCVPGIMPKTYGEKLSATQLETLVQFLSEQQ
ncbi:MAG TPA: c-type cytochrome [Anaerolineae bacterium]